MQLSETIIFQAEIFPDLATHFSGLANWVLAPYLCMEYWKGKMQGSYQKESIRLLHPQFCIGGTRSMWEGGLCIWLSEAHSGPVWLLIWTKLDTCLPVCRKGAPRRNPAFLESMGVLHVPGMKDWAKSLIKFYSCNAKYLMLLLPSYTGKGDGL